MNNKNNQKGITLVALTITIIVLLIIGGISLDIILGSDGIINRTQNSTQVYKKVAAKEKLDIKIANLKINETGTASLIDLKKSTQTDNELIVKLDNEINPTKAVVTLDEYTFTLDKDLKLVEDDNISDLPQTVLEGKDTQGKIQMKLKMPVTK